MAYRRNYSNDDFKFEIVEHVCKLSENDKGWTKELTRVSWNGRPAKYDIREWSPDYERMGKGISLTDEEAEIVAAAIANRYMKNYEEQNGAAFDEPEPAKPEKQADIVPFKKKAEPKPKKPKAEKQSKAEPKAKKVVNVGGVATEIDLPF